MVKLLHLIGKMGYTTCYFFQLAIAFIDYAGGYETSNWHVHDMKHSRVKREIAGINFHKGEFCVDVSTWSDIKWVDVQKEKCNSTFEKVCETKTEKVNKCNNIIIIILISNQCKVIYYIFHRNHSYEISLLISQTLFLLLAGV